MNTHPRLTPTTLTMHDADTIPTQLRTAAKTLASTLDTGHVIALTADLKFGLRTMAVLMLEAADRIDDDTLTIPRAPQPWRARTAAGVGAGT